MPVFSSKGAGTNLIRSTNVLGRIIQLKTGHGYYRPHKLPTGQITDLRTSGLTPDQIETAFKGPLSRTVAVSNILVTYRAVESAGGVINVPTYYAS
jgi:hypothetical protein